MENGHQKTRFGAARQMRRSDDLKGLGHAVLDVKEAASIFIVALGSRSMSGSSDFNRSPSPATLHAFMKMIRGRGVVARPTKLARSALARGRYRLAKNPTVAFVWRGKHNFGDLLNVSLIKRRTGSAPFHVHDVQMAFPGPIWSVIGTVRHVAIDARATVWQAGFICEDIRISKCTGRGDHAPRPTAPAANVITCGPRSWRT
jgi:hypothetical protein